MGTSGTHKENYKMKKKILYTCEYCHTDYADIKECEKCEAAHKKDLKIIDKRYVTHKNMKSGFPTTIIVQAEDGSTQTYRC